MISEKIEAALRARGLVFNVSDVSGDLGDVVGAFIDVLASAEEAGFCGRAAGRLMRQRDDARALAREAAEHVRRAKSAQADADLLERIDALGSGA